MNKIYNSNLKFNRLNFLINKILIKISLNVSNKSSYPLSLNLLREEIQRIILASVLIQCNKIFFSLAKTSLENINNKSLMDTVLKILLLSSKQNVAFKLTIPKYEKIIKLNPSNSWLLKDIELQEYKIVLLVLNSLKPSLKKKNSLILTESLIENFVIKLSDILSYELFYESKFSMVFFTEYTTDFFIFKDSIQKLRLRIYLKKLLDKKYILLRKIYNSKNSILIFTRDGLLLKNLSSVHLI